MAKTAKFVDLDRKILIDEIEKIQGINLKVLNLQENYLNLQMVCYI
jgi:hypothetical protein